MKNFTVEKLAKQALIAAIYAALTWALPNLSYGPIQFRVSEIMTLLAFYNPVHIIGLTLGCAIANIFSSLGAIDIIVGTLASFLALFAMSKVKNIWLASIMPALSAILIGLEIVLVSPTPLAYIPITLQIMVSELIIVTLFGVPIFKILQKNKAFNDLVLKDRTLSKVTL